MEVILSLRVSRYVIGSFSFLLALLFCVQALAFQDFKRIGVGDGLPNATIYSVTQDSHGYIWLTSTNSGLLRFDGYQFAEFQVLTPEEKKQLGSQSIQPDAWLDAGVLPRRNPSALVAEKDGKISILRQGSIRF